MVCTNTVGSHGAEGGLLCCLRASLDVTGDLNDTMRKLLQNTVHAQLMLASPTVQPFFCAQNT